MDCFGFLHMYNQMLLLFTCYTSLCLNWERPPLNIYLNRNIPWALYKLLYKIDSKHYFKNLIKLVFCLSTVLWASTSFFQGWRSCSSESQLLIHRTYGSSPQIVPESQGRVSEVILFLPQELKNPVTSRNRLLPWMQENCSESCLFLLVPTHHSWGWKYNNANPLQLTTAGEQEEAKAADIFK